jgi:hypothetical protein
MRSGLRFLRELLTISELQGLTVLNCELPCDTSGADPKENYD